jgi:hypothetical protein
MYCTDLSLPPGRTRTQLRCRYYEGSPRKLQFHTISWWIRLCPSWDIFPNWPHHCAGSNSPWAEPNSHWPWNSQNHRPWKIRGNPDFIVALGTFLKILSLLFESRIGMARMTKVPRAQKRRVNAGRFFVRVYHQSGQVITTAKKSDHVNKDTANSIEIEC